MLFPERLGYRRGAQRGTGASSTRAMGGPVKQATVSP